MPDKNESKYSRGFIDPLSLIGIGFLLITAIVGTVVANNRNISLNFAEKAICLDNECEVNSDCGTGYRCATSGGCKVCVEIPSPSASPSTTPCSIKKCSGVSCIATTVYVARGSSCPSSQCADNQDCGADPPNDDSSDDDSEDDDSDNDILPCNTCSSGSCVKKSSHCDPYLNDCEDNSDCNSDPQPTDPPITGGNDDDSTTCIGEGSVIASGMGDCCEGLEKKDCTASGSFSYCYCRRPTPPTPTPSSRNCTVRNCSGVSCVATSTTVPYSQTCPTSYCASDSDCKIMTPSPTPTPVPTSVPIVNAGCLCVNNIYVGACGHSSGYPCTTTQNVCETITCASNCASQVPGNTGTCLSGFCSCGSIKLKANGLTCGSDNECESGNCYSGSQTLGGSIFDTSKTCKANPIVTIDTTQTNLNTAVAIGDTAILTALAGPALGELGLLAYSYGTAYLTTLPASVQTAAAITGAVVGYAGVGVGTASCINNPYSDACVAYVAAIQGDPMAMIQLTNSTSNLIGTATKKTTFSLNSTGQIDINLLSPHEPGYNMQTVPQLKQILQEGGTLDPIRITQYGGKIYTVDGANRVTATLQSGESLVSYKLTQFEQLPQIQQTMIQEINQNQSLFNVYSIPTTYNEFPAFYNYTPTTIRK